MVAAAVILRKTPLGVRIDDSKLLTRRQRVRAFHVIMEHAEVGVGIVCAEEIDRRNILQATLLAMQRAAEDLPRPADLLLVDGNVAPPLSTPCWPLVHGDRRSVVIGCASIVAKVLRDRLMEFYHHLWPHYAFNQHKGYGTALHRERLRAYGSSVLHRRSFRPVLEAMARMRPERSDEPALHEPTPLEELPPTASLAPASSAA